MANINIKTLHRKRGNLKHRLSTLETFCNEMPTFISENKLNEEQADIICLRLENCREIGNDFKDLQNQIEEICEDKNLDREYEERDAFENYYEKIYLKLNKLLLSANQSIDHPAINHSVRPISGYESHVKLPIINIPKFSGIPTEWLEFKELYESLIHTNKNLSKVEKFHYLRTSLSGSAAKVIQNISLSDTNYELVWENLGKRYQNKEVLIYEHIKAIFDLHNTNNTDPKAFRSISDELNKHTKYMSQIGDMTYQRNALLIYILTNKLDKQSLKEWEEYTKNTDGCMLQNFQDFITNKAEVLEKIEHRGAKSSYQSNQNQRKHSFLTMHNACQLCEQTHSLIKCPDFQKLDPKQRYEKVKSFNLCTNCLRGGHASSKCTSYKCKKCNKAHNTLLHFESSQTSVNMQNILSSQINNNSLVLLSTVSLYAIDKNGDKIKCRALLDNGSQSNFITYDLLRNLGLSSSSANISATGISHVPLNIHHECQIRIKSFNNNFETKIKCFALNTISDNMPNFEINVNDINLPKTVQLADPDFFVPSRIDILLGAELFWKILQPERIDLGKDLPILQNSNFGWIVTGSFCSTDRKFRTQCNLSLQNLHDDIQKFWHVEENYNQKAPLTMEEQECESHFINTFIRKPDGRFIVSVPFKQSPENLGNSFDMAEKRFIHNERKRLADSSLKQQYIQFMDEYKSLGHMTKIENPVVDNGYYLPHRAVIKTDSLTTKCRVVFDGSAITTNGLSLNSIQHVGPIVQNDLLSILIRFRQHAFVFSADICKMYRQIEINPTQRKYQRILWRSEPETELEEYELNTVTYGTASAPYLATRCIQQLSLDAQEKYPEASKIISRDFYIDDLLSGSDTIDEAVLLIDQITKIMKSGGFPLTKWCSNNLHILKKVETNNQLSHYINMGEISETKLLGLQWNFISDSLIFYINNNISTNKVTKRSILSNIAKTFDPLGLLSPLVILLKILLQQIWSLHLDWDDELPEHLQQKWHNFRSNLSCINNISIPRFVFQQDAILLELHGFSDASESAYGACVYARSVNNNNEIKVQLICAKSKVAPMKTLTIPRLELCGAVVLSNLVQRIKTSFTIKLRCFYWTDSKVVLSWIQNQSRLFNIFVANRVSIIQNLTDINEWSHVGTHDNPADLITRGLQPNELQNSIIWWQGPYWLSQTVDTWPINNISEMPLTEIPERKIQINTVFGNQNKEFYISQFSSLTKAKRVMAYCCRFVKNCKTKYKNDRQQGALTLSEIDHAFSIILKISQGNSFSLEISILRHTKVLPAKNKLNCFHPFIDEQGLLRVGGRLKNSSLPTDQIHPIILDSKSHLCTLILRYEHLRHYHAGPQHLLYISRQRFWIIHGKTLAKKIVRNCVRCFRANPKFTTPIMGNLPSCRTHLSYPFIQTGTDFAGPFLIRDRRGRGNKTLKCYICIFVCTSVKAIHFEPLTDLTTNTFLLAFRRFISRRGLPTDVYSDNGRTYVKASSDLQELGRFLLKYKDELGEQILKQNINWHFIPAYSPNFGGLWEAGVKSLKYHLKRVLANALVTFEEFLTITTEIEGILNSRPISEMSNESSDLQPLSPGHFLIGRSITSIIDKNLLDVKQNLLTNYQVIEQLRQHFWSRWYKEYISELQCRHKWKKNIGNIKQGTLVVLKDNNLPPLCWKTGRIVELHPGSDGVVRVVSIKTSNGVVKRAASQVCGLPIDSET